MQVGMEFTLACRTMLQVQSMPDDAPTPNLLVQGAAIQ